MIFVIWNLKFFWDLSFEIWNLYGCWNLIHDSWKEFTLAFSLYSQAYCYSQPGQFRHSPSLFFLLSFHCSGWKYKALKEEIFFCGYILPCCSGMFQPPGGSSTQHYRGQSAHSLQTACWCAFHGLDITMWKEDWELPQDIFPSSFFGWRLNTSISIGNWVGPGLHLEMLLPRIQTGHSGMSTPAQAEEVCGYWA